MKKNHWFEETSLGKHWLVGKDFIDGDYDPDDWEEEMLGNMSAQELGFLEGEIEAESSLDDMNA